MDTQALYLLEEPVETIFGDIGYLHLNDYIKLAPELSTISKQPLHMYYEFRKQLDKVPDEDRGQFLNEIEPLKTISLFDLLHKDYQVKKCYLKIFEKVIDFKDDVNIEDIFKHEEYLYSLRKLVMEMNYLKEDPVSPNPEIQEYYEQRKEMKMKESGGVNFSDIISSVAVGMKCRYKEVKEMTIFQFYHSYYRIGSFKKHDQSTILATVTHDAKMITSWTEKIDLFEEEKLGLDYDSFNKKYNDIFNA